MVQIAELIAYQARIGPERTAIVAGDKVVTYGMLERAVLGIMRRLEGPNLAPGSIVAISIEAQSRHMAVSLALARMGLVSAPFKSRAGLDALPKPALVLSDRTMLLADGRLSTEVTDDWYAGSSGTGPLPRLELADEGSVPGYSLVGHDRDAQSRSCTTTARSRRMRGWSSSSMPSAACGGCRA